VGRPPWDDAYRLRSASPWSRGETVNGGDVHSGRRIVTAKKQPSGECNEIDRQLAQDTVVPL
jgi:hypothetical protein